MLDGKNVLLGVTGGIAVYKSAYVVSGLKKAGANVDVIMTDAATKFVSPLTFETLSANPVTTDMFSREKPWEVEHIALAQKADLAVIAPATANTIAKLACGIADNMLTTTILACTCKTVIVPAMNTAMYENIATQVNLQILKDRGYMILPPADGQLACGTTGAGRMREPWEIIDFLQETTKEESLQLAGKKVLITAGPTREAIDPVRYITNRSSGKMGYALARNACLMGAEVMLVSGPVGITPPAGVSVYPVESAQQMYEQVVALKDEADIIIMCAAVADYTPEVCEEHKMKKRETLCLNLVKTRDILAEVGKNKKAYLVGFAAETRNLEEYAKEKLIKKNLDMIVANDVSGSQTGFDSDDNAVSIYTPDDGAVHLSKRNKNNIAAGIMEEIIKHLK